MLEKPTTNKGRRFTLQWHVTALCGNRCRHCYMYDSPTYRSECQNMLSFEACIEIIDDFVAMLNAWQVSGRINFTGGDPLMRPDVFDLVKYARDQGVEVGILGNPELLDKETVTKLKAVGLASYQLSIDGMESTHDHLRSAGSFRRTVSALALLRDACIHNVVMFTLSRLNSSELIPVIRMVNELKVDVFDFARVVPVGAGEQLKAELICPEDYHSLLLEVLELYRQLKEAKSHTHYGRKDHLWKLIYHELGMFGLFPIDKETIFDGCSVGVSLLTILADGAVMACRRLPVIIGKVPDQSLREIFIESDVLMDMRQEQHIQKCGICSLRQFCRGCRAVAYGATGSYMAPDPQCWRKEPLVSAHN